MKNSIGLSAQKKVAWISILSYPIALAAMFFAVACVDYDIELARLPVAAMQVVRADYLMAFGFTDILGYYLLRVPMIIFLWHWLRHKDPVMADIATVCGLFYIFLAVTSSSILVGGTTGILELYETASDADKPGLEAAWSSVVMLAYRGPWLFMLLPWLFWSFQMGKLLKTEVRFLGLALQLVAVSSALGVLGPLLNSSLLSLFDDFQVHFMPLWIVWAAVVLLRSEIPLLERQLDNENSAIK